jgi:hypothetical protein
MMTDARDAASVLGAVDACGGASVQARVLARPLAPFRKDMVQRLGKTLMQRFSRGSRCPRPHAVLAWAMAPRIPAVAVAVVGARPDPKAALAVLSAMHPQARAVSREHPAPGQARCAGAALQQEVGQVSCAQCHAPAGPRGVPREPPAPGQGQLRRGGAAAGKLRPREGGSAGGGFTLRDQAGSLLLLGKEAQGLVRCCAP